MLCFAAGSTREAALTSRPLLDRNRPGACVVIDRLVILGHSAETGEEGVDIRDERLPGK
jgi:hypothetical protein